MGNSSPAPEGFSVHIRLATDLRSRASIIHPAGAEEDQEDETEDDETKAGQLRSGLRE